MSKPAPAQNAAAVAVVAAMVAAAELLGEREIIFPEMAALAVGMLAAPRRPWQTSRSRTALLIAVCAITGVLIVRYVHAPLWAQMSLAFLLCQLLFVSSGTTFAPMISAMVLPVFLGTASWVYPAAAIILTLAMGAVQLIFERLGVRERETFTPRPLPGGREMAELLLRVAAAAAVIFAAMAAGAKFCVVPPLLVAFTEFSNRNCSARKAPVETVLLIALCACAGSLCRIAADELALPLTVAAAAAFAMALLVMHRTARYLPPAGAMSVLPMLLERYDAAVFPLQVTAGAAVLMALAMLLFPKRAEETAAA